MVVEEVGHGDRKIQVRDQRVSFVQTPWQTATLAAIHRLASPGRRFTRQELIRRELPRIVAEIDSHGTTPAQTLSRVLQELRDLGHIEFLGPGQYRRQR